jgi:hypothetical protein
MARETITALSGDVGVIALLSAFAMMPNEQAFEVRVGTANGDPAYIFTVDTMQVLLRRWEVEELARVLRDPPGASDVPADCEALAQAMLRRMTFLADVLAEALTYDPHRPPTVH